MCEKCKESDYTVHGLQALNGFSRIFAGRTPCVDYYIEFKYKLNIDDFLDARDQIFLD
ncbi:MAG: hypothetical protein ACM3MI_10530 [Clostridiales bacterium]